MADSFEEALQGFVPSGDLAVDVPALLSRHGRDGVAAHVQRVAANAQRLAARFGVNEKAAVTAAWLHDVSQILPFEVMLEAALTGGVEVLPEDRQAPSNLHGRLSAVVAEGYFGVTDPMVLDAIRYHTTLRAGATQLDKLLLTADKLAWDPADAPFYNDLAAAAERSLDDAVRCYLTWAWGRRDSMPVVHPWMRQACRELGIADSGEGPA